MNSTFMMLLKSFSSVLSVLYRARAKKTDDPAQIKQDNILRLDTATRKMRRAHIDYVINHEHKTLEIPTRALYTGVATLTLYRIEPNDGRQPYWAISKDGFELIFKHAQQ